MNMNTKGLSIAKVEEKPWCRVRNGARATLGRQPLMATGEQTQVPLDLHYFGGADRIRTCDPHNAIVVLYQLSYDPIPKARETL